MSSPTGVLTHPFHIDFKKLPQTMKTWELGCFLDEFFFCDPPPTPVGVPHRWRILGPAPNAGRKKFSSQISLTIPSGLCRVKEACPRQPNTNTFAGPSWRSAAGGRLDGNSGRAVVDLFGLAIFFLRTDALMRHVLQLSCRPGQHNTHFLARDLNPLAWCLRVLGPGLHNLTPELPLQRLIFQLWTPLLESQN